MLQNSVACNNVNWKRTHPVFSKGGSSYPSDKSLCSEEHDLYCLDSNLNFEQLGPDCKTVPVKSKFLLSHFTVHSNVKNLA